MLLFLSVGCAKWSNWTSWSACCINKQSRYRTCLRSNFDGIGTQCAGNDRIFRHCWGCPSKFENLCYKFYEIFIILEPF